MTAAKSFLDRIVGTFTGGIVRTPAQRRADRLATLLRTLISEKGEASGAMMARRALALYRGLDAAGRLHFFQNLARDFSPNRDAVLAAAQAYHANPSAEHLALLQRLGHEMLIDPQVGRLLDELEKRDLDPESWDGALVRVARRDYQKAVQVPVELSSEMARAAAESAPGWLEAKATSNFSIFLPLMERNVELRHRYVECFGDQAEPYDVLLDDYEP